MESLAGFIMVNFLQWCNFLQSESVSMSALAAALFFCGLLALTIGVSQWTQTPGPPRLFDPIPYLFNTVQFLTDNYAFMKRVSCVLLCPPPLAPLFPKKCTGGCPSHGSKVCVIALNILMPSDGCGQ